MTKTSFVILTVQSDRVGGVEDPQKIMRSESRIPKPANKQTIKKCSKLPYYSIHTLLDPNPHSTHLHRVMSYDYLSRDESLPSDFRIWMDNGIGQKIYLDDLPELQHASGEELAQLVPERSDGLGLQGSVRGKYHDYKRLLLLLHSTRRWRSILLSDEGATRATPEFLSLVVLAITKTNQVDLTECPLDQNLFACLNSGMQTTLTKLVFSSNSVPMTYEAATIFSSGLAWSGSLERLRIVEECSIEPGAGLKLLEGIQRNRSLEDLDVCEANLGTMAMVPFIRAISQGGMPKLHSLSIKLRGRSGLIDSLTTLMSSDTCGLTGLTIDANRNGFRPIDAQLGNGNDKLKRLEVWNGRALSSYLKTMLPRMNALCALTLRGSELYDITPIVDHLCRPNTVIKSILLTLNSIGIDQAENFCNILLKCSH